MNQSQAMHTPQQALLWMKSFIEAEQRKSDRSLPLEVRIRSAETCALLLRAAHDAGETYESMNKLVDQGIAMGLTGGRCVKCGGAIPATGRFDRTGECNCETVAKVTGASE